MLRENKKNTHNFKDVKISTIYSGIKNKSSKEDDLLLIEFDKEVNVAGVFTKSLTSSAPVNQCKYNIKSSKLPSVRAIIVNSGNANAFTGSEGYEALKDIAGELSIQLSKKQNEDEDYPKKILKNEILFGCTGTIGEKYPREKIKKNIPELIKKIKYTQNKLIWLKAALGIMTTDLCSSEIIHGYPSDITSRIRHH